MTPRNLLVALGVGVVLVAQACGGSGSDNSTPTEPPAPGAGGGGALAACTITFDGSCPDAQTRCGADFVGGGGCRSIGIGSCYSSGSRSYDVTTDDVVEIQLQGDLTSLEVFFAAGGGGQGEMTFFDAGGVRVTSIDTNGDCTVRMPLMQNVVFDTPVRSIEVRSDGSRSWIDDFHVNPG